ncbi:MAG: protein BatD [Nitrospiraceae bacterium]|nr:MAG: protein BatD [Nitrospiraceae bacterium]
MGHRKRYTSAVISLFFITVLLIPPFVYAGEVRFQASLDRDGVYLGQSAQLELQFQGSTDIPAPDVPAIDGLQFRYIGPSTMMSIVNGRMSSSVTHMYSLVPLKTGKFQIGPISFQHEGNTYTSNVLTIEVLDSTRDQGGRTEQQKKPAVSLDDRVFVKMHAGKRIAYANEIIPLTIKLYVRGIGVRDIQYPEYNRDGFSGGQFDKPGQYQETVKGIVYDVVEFKTTIFATNDGTYKLGPARIKANIVTRTGRNRHSSFDKFFGRDPFDDFFGQYETHPVELKSEPLSLKVLPLPETGKPSDFKGALGSFKFNLEVSPTEVKAGDPVTLKMIISGSGNFDSVASPALKQHDGFKSYEPQGKQEGDRKIFEQVLIPTTDTINEVPAVSFSFFNTDRGEFQTITKTGIPLKVLKSDRMEEVTILDAKENSGAPAVRERLGRDIIYIKESPGVLKQKGGYLSKDPLFLFLQALPLLAFIGAWIMQRRKERLSTDVGYARRLSAPRKARKGIREAEDFLAKNMSMEFYDAVFRTLRDYIGDRFHVPSGGLTSDSAAEVLKDRGLQQDMLSRLINIFRECDMARYAPSEPGTDKMHGTLKQLKETIDYLERHKA